MSDSGTRARAILDAWREQHADRMNPLRFHFIEALERRAAGHDGEARRLLDDRLSRLIGTYAGDLEMAAFNAGASDSATTPCVPARGALGALLDHFANRAARHGDDPATIDAVTQPATLPTMDALGEFQKIWSQVRTDSQIRQSLEQVPANAGPLNSGSLVHRSLALMRELSPGYLQQFLAYVDTLSWMEQMSDGGALAAKEAPRAASARKRTRSKRAYPD
ncbi:hypothetical protein B0E46_11760 [Rhodanobacter sp. B04]|uniref:DUF2894 domain-containing protein n=1 Tax=Rhodanobacter sp. B04 TaxID=1945860 RepID=UPI000986801C|nr:DUF2894 domain-containing protein [Rhodanobacter sp. B04]OOG62884.1 hypothetical protein B0E46_11760 [Rhodanobacter sp. B04]